MRSDGYSWHCQDGFTPGPAPMGLQPGWGLFAADYNNLPDDYPGPAPIHNGY